MIDLNCPNCGRAGSAPREKHFVRLLCKACKQPFYLTDSGQALQGDPPPPEGSKEPRQAKAHEPTLSELEEREKRLARTALTSVGGVVATLVLGWFVWGFLKPGPEHLNPIASKAVQAFVDDDLAYLKSIATPESVNDLVKWFDEAHPKLDRARGQWKDKTPLVEFQAVGEDHDRRLGLSQASLRPSSGESAQAAVDLPMCWTLDKEGHWRLDGGRTYQSSQMMH